MDLGVNGNVFGGRILAWLDEAGSIYAFKLIGPVVLLKISEVLFKTPVRERDIIDILGAVKDVGMTSISIEMDVIKVQTKEMICTCEAKFVHIDEKGNKVPIPEERREMIKKQCGVS
ncbi:MAG: hypothetical protein RBG13Loki_0830 [Promethearchaeota archaeon CR_4]|nr:MAG: hypothetical protein RBG13Loki_0830 [Candidatus Lokiarchaeota archaeon CR_4]